MPHNTSRIKQNESYAVDQLEKIFEAIETKKMMEAENIPPGSDTPDAPWNQKRYKTSKAITAKGDFELVGNTFGEFF